ncbi:MAG: DUF3153 domain-containing protein [Spirulinaceae cyanobacterium SM2_1_0]|nr:DUF3153 domain-containing protein [Spirulinaceae cyanobacterium SM2_1_0]
MATLLLTGCVRYEVGVTVDGQFSGAIVQQVEIGEQLTSFSRREAERWLDTIAQRARRLHGRVREVSESEIIATIPFHNGQELVQNFNQFFDPTGQTAAEAATVLSEELIQLTARTALRQQNFLLLERDRLALDIDLRGLSVLDDAGSTLAIDPGRLLDLEFALNTPWGARALNRSTDEPVSPPVERRGRQLVWRLQPGVVNHLAAAYWLPSWLGLGSLAIALLVAAGAYVKYTLLAPRQPTPVPKKS